MQPLPTLSVVIDCQIARPGLVGLIENVLLQGSEVECIVVTAESIEREADLGRRFEGRITVIVDEKADHPSRLKRGIEESTGDLVAWLEPQDRWMRGTYSAVSRLAAEYPLADVFYGCSGLMGPDGRLIRISPARTWDFQAAIVGCDPIIVPGVGFVRRSTLERLGGLCGDWSYQEDLWVRIGLAGGSFHATPLILGYTIPLSAKFPRPGLRARAALGLTRRALADPRLPPEIRRQRRTAISNAHLRSIRFLRPGVALDWGRGLLLLARAAWAEPRNVAGSWSRLRREIFWIAEAAAKSWVKAHIWPLRARIRSSASLSLLRFILMPALAVGVIAGSIATAIEPNLLVDGAAERLFWFLTPVLLLAILLELRAHRQ